MKKSFHTLNPMNGVLCVILSLCNFIWSFVGKCKRVKIRFMLFEKCLDHMDAVMFIFHRHLQTFYYLSGEWEHSCFRASSKIYSLPNALWCWYWQFYVENIQTEYYHHFGIFNFSTLNFVLDENPIFCGCQFDGPKV